jgi:hypothetical protein
MVLPEIVWEKTLIGYTPGMKEHKLSEQIIGLQAPWSVQRSPEARRKAKLR